MIEGSLELAQYRLQKAYDHLKSALDNVMTEQHI